MRRTTPAKQIALAAMIATVIADQVSKFWLVGLLAKKHEIVVAPFFRLVQVWNRGVSFGLLNRLQTPEAQKGPLELLTVAIIFALLQWLYRTRKKLQTFALGLIIGGAIGNLIDRFNYGAVADFLDFHIGDYHWPAFNVADSCIVIGIGLILLDSVKGKVKDKSVPFASGE